MDATNKTVQLKANISDKCYVYFDKLPSAKYWNDDFSGSEYAIGAMPASNKTYASLAELQAAYATHADFPFAGYPFYIKTTTEHQACLYWEPTKKEFCMSRKYWVGDGASTANGEATKTKLQREMAAALGINESDLSCSSNSSNAYCYVSSFYCGAISNGSVDCYDNDAVVSCTVYGDGAAACILW